MSDRSQIDEIKDRLDIVSVVQEYVPSLKKSGRNFFAPCPFHQEKTPSFSVNSELGLFKCFGCGEGGDAIKFLEKIEGLDFAHALELAAKRAGVELKKFSNPQLKKQRQEKDRILEVNTLVAKYFNYLLTDHKLGRIAREYVNQRKLTKTGVVTYRLGFAPVGFENLKKFLTKRGFTETELVKWGLLASKNGRNYDKFRNRLMFPIMDHQGDVVGFSGRSIDPEDKGPKYLNSPETPVYNKSKLLYGLFQAKESIRKQDFAVIVEGNIDIVSSYQAGVKNIVAPLGTALTEDQLKLLKRYCTKIYLAFDSDSAGQKALLKSLELAEKVGLQTFAVDIGKYHDVDDLIKAGEDWVQVVASAKPVVDFLIKALAANYDLEDSKQKATYVKQVLSYIAKIDNDIEKADYLEKLSRKAKVERDLLISQLTNMSSGNQSTNQSDTQTKQTPVFRLDSETYLLSLLLQHPQWLSLADKLDPKRLFAKEENFQLFEAISQNKTVPLKLRELYQNIKMSPLEDVFGSKTEFERELSAASNRLRKALINKRMIDLQNNDDDSTLRELAELSKEIGQIRT